MSGDERDSGGGQSPTDSQKSVPAPNGPSRVFISYASQDVAIADAIVAALERHGLTCWIAPRDVVPGESYAGAIVHAIDSTKLLVLVLSEHGAASQHVLREVERASSKRHPVLAFRTSLAPMPADLEYFLNTSQWLDASTSSVERALPKLVDAVQRNLAPRTNVQSDHTRDTAMPTSELAATRRIGLRANHRLSHLLIALGAVIALALGYFVVDRFWLSQRGAFTKRAVVALPAASSFMPPLHSIAVLPFVNMSGDKEQEYFSDGLTEEILNSLARIDQLQVAARTSSFSFKDRKVSVATIARELNVGVVLEGSVRRSGRTVRITAELINAATGYDLWSETFDRDLRDVLKLQSEIANSVANALKITLLGNLAAKIELGGTHNPDALDSYLRAIRDYYNNTNEKSLQGAIATFTVAINQDPDFALAYAGRSVATNFYATEYATEQAMRETLAKAQRDAQHAIDLAPNLSEGHRALAAYYASATIDFKRAMEEYGRAVALAPGSAETLRTYGLFSIQMGHTASGIAALKKAVALDPLSPITLGYLGGGYWEAHQFDASVGAFSEALKLAPNKLRLSVQRGLSYYAAGDLPNARTSCEVAPDNWLAQVCLTVTLYKLGRPKDAQIIMEKLIRSNGDVVAYQCAEIETQRGNAPKALEWLEKTVRAREGAALKQLLTDPLLDPLRAEPRFQAIQRQLFP